MTRSPDHGITRMATATVLLQLMLLPAVGEAQLARGLAAVTRGADDLTGTAARRLGCTPVPSVRGLARRGDDLWQLATRASLAARQLDKPAARLQHLARRLGPPVLALEARCPGCALRVVRHLGDDAVALLARRASAGDITQLVGLARRARSPAARRALLAEHRRLGPSFMRHINWKAVMAIGLTVALVTSAARISGGVADGVRVAAANNPAAVAETIPRTVGLGAAVLVAPLAVLILAGWGLRRARRRRVRDG